MVNFNVEEKRGKIILHTGSMNGGKSFELVTTCLQLEFSRYNVLAFTPVMDIRSGSFISANNGQLKYPSTAINHEKPEEILNHIFEADKHKKVDVIVIDETNFFSSNLVNVVQQLRDDNRAIIVGGLDYDFRGESFGPTPFLKLIADELRFHYPNCKVVKCGEECSRPAKYTMRLLKINGHFNKDDVVSFAKDRTNIIRKKYVWAPYYSPTIYVENDKDEVIYSAACSECFKVPRKDATLGVYNFIANNPEGIIKEEIKKAFSETGDLEKILKFLSDEHRVELKEGERFAPKRFVKDYSILGNYRAI